jgi:threonine dehydrogenase-like Zn-dependent dehydrogenase
VSQIVGFGATEVSCNAEEVPKPRVVEDRDVILKVTGSTVCGSDLHLLHGTVVEMEKGDILGHEFCGLVESMGPGVKGLKKGDRVVASFQIACGEVRMLLVNLIDYWS